MGSFSQFDTRGYRTVAPREGYDRWAATYEETVEDAMDVGLLERLEVDWGAVGRAADLGCGTGRTGAWLKARGVGEVDGVDLSPGMLDAARARGAYVSLREGDVGDTGLEAGAYDLVVACLVDEHVAAGLDVGLTLAALHERVVDDEWVALKPKWERFRHHPISFAFAWSCPAPPRSGPRHRPAVED